jgi:hypothetical protein
MRAIVSVRSVLALLALCLSPLPAHADLGPKPDDRLHFTVTLEGQPVPDASFVAGLLCWKDKRKGGPDNMGAVVPGLKERFPPDTSGGGWTYGDYKWGGQGADGHVEFHGFYGSNPERFRLAVYLPSRQMLFVTNEVDTHPLLTEFHVDLHDDGTGTLRRDETGRLLADALVGLSRRGMPLALAATLLVELGVAAVVVLSLRKRSLLGRVCLVCCGANLLTLPPVWVVSLIGFWLFGLWGGMATLAGMEFGATVCEGLFYATIGRLGWSAGFGLSLLANAASFGLGLLSGLL